VTRSTKKRKVTSRRRLSARPVWPVQDARSNLSAVIDAALKGEPQHITRNGKEVVTVIRSEDIRAAKATPEIDLLEVFQNSPLTDALERGLIDFAAMRSKAPFRDPFEFQEGED
jgi:prevent-host-death family protein